MKRRCVGLNLMNSMQISVGVYSRKEVCVVFHGTYMNEAGLAFSGDYTFSNPGIYTPMEADAYFELKDVTIGIQFHWQRNENQIYKGVLKVVEDADGNLAAINVLDVEEYLCSVISSEMSATSMLELLKAHAVISRSWAVRKIQERASLGATSAGCKTDYVFNHDGKHIAWYGAEPHTLFDVCGDDHCQRYYGFTRAVLPQVAEAVKATSGMVLTYGGNVCDCRYYKCCGGLTEEFDTCWEDVEVPYLKSVKDDYCSRATPEILGQVLNGYDLETTDYYEWRVEYSQAELFDIVRERSGIKFGTILDLIPLKRGKSGRIYELQIVGSQNTLVVGKELEIRKWLSRSHLYSSAFNVERTADGGFVLQGKGWGHGVGLCQIGAAVMASEGKTYQEILNFYYPDASISKLGHF